jgi:hypothetical protein
MDQALEIMANLGPFSNPSLDDLIDRAVASREEHAIKFTDACLQEYRLNRKDIYLQAARDAISRL